MTSMLKGMRCCGVHEAGSFNQAMKPGYDNRRGTKHAMPAGGSTSGPHAQMVPDRTGVHTEGMGDSVAYDMSLRKTYPGGDMPAHGKRGKGKY